MSPSKASSTPGVRRSSRLSKTTTPLSSLPRPTTRSRTRSVTPSSSSATDIELSDSSDDEDGVFLGDHRPEESSFLNKLTPASPQPGSPSSSTSARNGSSRSAPSSLKKRDSLEFHRRKTILLPVDGNITSLGVEGSGKAKEKVWEGGFYEKKESPSRDCPPGSTSSQRTIYYSSRTDLEDGEADDPGSSSSRQTVFYSASTSTPLRTPARHAVESHRKQHGVDQVEADQEDSEPYGSSSSEPEGDSDKENVGPSSRQSATILSPRLALISPRIPRPPTEGSKEPDTTVDLPARDDTDTQTPSEVTHESDADEVDEEVACELDMGGLRLSDFGDQSDDFDEEDASIEETASSTTNQTLEDDETDVMEPAEFEEQPEQVQEVENPTEEAAMATANDTPSEDETENGGTDNGHGGDTDIALQSVSGEDGLGDDEQVDEVASTYEPRLGDGASAVKTQGALVKMQEELPEKTQEQNQEEIRDETQEATQEDPVRPIQEETHQAPNEAEEDSADDAMEEPAGEPSSDELGCKGNLAIHEHQDQTTEPSTITDAPTEKDEPQHEVGSSPIADTGEPEPVIDGTTPADGSNVQPLGQADVSGDGALTIPAQQDNDRVSAPTVSDGSSEESTSAHGVEELVANLSLRSGSTNLESPLPVARGGPVMIPQMPDHLRSIRAESGSPFRDLPRAAPLSFSPFHPSPENHDPDVKSSPNVVSARMPRTPISAPTPSKYAIPSSAGPAAVTPAAHAGESSGGMGAATKSKMLKSTLASSQVAASVDRVTTAAEARNERKAAARALAIRGRLDAALTGKLASLGPPQRAVSSSSSVSASSRTSQSTGPTRPPSRNAFGQPTRSVSGSSTSAVPGHRKPSSDEVPKRPVEPAKVAPGSNRPRPSFAQPTLASRAASRPSLAASHIKTQGEKPRITSISSRPPLAPRALPQPTVRPGSSLSSHPRVPSTKITAVSQTSRQVSTHETTSTTATAPNPLKRPLPPPTLAKSISSSSGARPHLGLPSRLVRTGPPGSAAVFSVGSGPEAGAPARQAFRSPGRGSRRGYGSPLTYERRLGTPSRMGTPSRPVPRRQQPVVAYYEQMQPRKVSEPVLPTVESSTVQASDLENANLDKGDPVKDTMKAPVDDAGPGSNGGSSDQADSGTAEPATDAAESPSDESGKTSEGGEAATAPDQPASGSTTEEGQSNVAATRSSGPAKPPSPPASSQGSQDSPRRPRRVIKKPSTTFTTHATRPAPPPSIVPNMSEKELKAITARHTARNEVYLCAIDKQVVRKPGPRPPSPTSKIRTTAEREEAERKASREDRAKRRSRPSDSTAATDEEEEPMTMIEKVTRFRGDEADYVTPVRPFKRAKSSHNDNTKALRWDRGVTIIRDFGDGARVARTEASQDNGKTWPKSVYKSRVELDQHGNVKEGTRPIENLKRNRVHVTSVFYDGEEPYSGSGSSKGSADSTTTSQSGGKGKKKA